MKTTPVNTMTTALQDNGIFTVTIDVPDETMNIVNQQMAEEFDALGKEIEENDAIKAVIFTSGKSSSFIAGADIKMLDAVETQMDGEAIAISAQTLFGRITNSRKPHLVAIDGVCLGAGYELALACHYRIASTNPAVKIGLPEVMLGLLPGGMGNSTLPRLINLPRALDLLLTGKQLDSKRAKRAGLIDEVVPETILLAAAEKKALELIKKGIPQRRRPLLDKLLTLPLVKDIVIKKAREQVLKKTKGGYPAPLAILDVVQQGLNKPLAEALKIEAEKFGELTTSPEAKALIHLYFATNALKKEPVTETKVKPLAINKIGVLGGGLMGAGIATVSIAKADTSVRLKDIGDEGLLGVHQHIDQYFQQRIKKGIVTAEAAKKKINQLTSSLTYSGFKQCNLIVEAVFENLNIKHQMVADIEALGNEDTLFASNTSSIPIKEIAAKAKRPENILGMHYFSPVEKMPLLEIIKHEGTSDQALATAVDFGRKQGKTVIVVNDGAGFYVNRILAPYLNAALELGLAGVKFDEIDNALTTFGFPVGPIKLLDEVGLDVGSKIQPVLEAAFGERMAGPGVHDKLIEKQRLGKKVKKGFYLYNNAKANNTIDPTVYDDLNITQSIDMEERTVIERCVFLMLNEAVRCLDEGIIRCARDGDIGAVFGIGFPPFLGGPFRYLDELGAGYVVEELRQLEKEHGNKYEPAARLVVMAENEHCFYQQHDR